MVEKTSEQIKGDDYSVMIDLTKTGYLTNMASSGFQVSDFHALSATRSVGGRVFVSGQSALVADTSSDPDFVDGGIPVASLLCVAVKTGSRTLGILSISTRARHEFNESEIKKAEAIAEDGAAEIEKFLTS